MIIVDDIYIYNDTTIWIDKSMYCRLMYVLSDDTIMHRDLNGIWIGMWYQKKPIDSLMYIYIYVCSMIIGMWWYMNGGE